MQGAATIPRPERWREELDHLVEAGPAIGLYSTAERQKGGGITPPPPPPHLLPVPPTGPTQPEALHQGSQQMSVLYQQSRLRTRVHLRLTGPDLCHDDCFKAKPTLHLNSSACLLNNFVLAKKYIQESILRDMAGNTNLHIVS